MSRKSTEPLRVFERPHLVWQAQFRELEGILLTIVDGSFNDKEQRDAVKSMVRRGMYTWLRSCPELESEGTDSPNFKIK